MGCDGGSADTGQDTTSPSDTEMEADDSGKPSGDTPGPEGQAVAQEPPLSPGEQAIRRVQDAKAEFESVKKRASAFFERVQRAPLQFNEKLQNQLTGSHAALDEALAAEEWEKATELSLELAERYRHLTYDQHGRYSTIPQRLYGAGSFGWGERIPPYLQLTEAERDQAIMFLDAALEIAPDFERAADLRSALGLQFFDLDEVGQVGHVYHNGAHMRLVYIPAGTFQMGSHQSPEEIVKYPGALPQHQSGFEREHPLHTVTITKSFLMGQMELSQREWGLFMDKDPSKPFSFSTKGEAPVQNVSWESAMEFCRRLTEHEREAGRIDSSWAYTLPTEAQWEYACRAGTTTPYAFGDTVTGEVANYNGNGTFSPEDQRIYRQQVVHCARFDPNPWGLYNMHGNVQEWCLDLVVSHKAKYPDGPVVDPIGTKGYARVTRGGDYLDPAYKIRSASRRFEGDWKSGGGYGRRGFRVVLVRVNP